MGITDRILTHGRTLKQWLIVLTSILVLVSCGNKKNDKKISDKLTLAGENTDPMGGYLCKYFSQKAFSNNEIENNSKPFDKWHSTFLTDRYLTSANTYFIVTPQLRAYASETKAMLNFVQEGNTLFIASNYFSEDLLKALSVELKDEFSFRPSAANLNMRDSYKQMADSTLFDSTQYSFFFHPMQKWLLARGSENVETLGYNTHGKPDLLRFQRGKGQLILMTNVQACTNYFLLTKQNHEYLLKAFSYLPSFANHVYWDDFYRRNTTRQPEGKGMLSAILAIPPLRWAFWVILAGIGVWVLTGLFRKQRTVPVLRPYTNSSLEFTQTIARLYFNKKDNRNIALKMISFLQDHLRNKYYMNYQGMNEEWAHTLAAKTGINPSKALQLLAHIKAIHQNNSVDDSTLLQLNEQIQEIMKQ